MVICSKNTEKLKPDQGWNNLAFLYDIKRSSKMNGFKYKILNFKEHGHGPISVVKGISSLGNKTRWITGGFNKKVYIWSIDLTSSNTTLDSKELMSEHTSAVSALHYCKHTNSVFSGGMDGKVYNYTEDGSIKSSCIIKRKKIRDIMQVGSNPSSILIS